MPTEGKFRVPYITAKDQISDEWHDHYDRIAVSRGRVHGPFSVLMNSPEVAARIADVGAYVHFEGTLPGPARELAIITTVRELDCAYEWAIHEPLRTVYVCQHAREGCKEADESVLRTHDDSENRRRDVECREPDGHEEWD